METVLTFCYGLGYIPTVMPAAFGLGDDAMLEEIQTKKFKSAVAGGLSELSAVLKVHDLIRVEFWAEIGLSTLKGMFSAMQDGEIGVGFFPALPITINAWMYADPTKAEESWFNLGPMEGLIYTDEGKEPPSVIGKISVKTDAVAK